MAQHDTTGARDALPLRSQFPDAGQLFQIQIRPLAELRDASAIFLDTSALLLPYQASKVTNSAIEEVLGVLLREKRLFIPAQAAREFVRNRNRKIVELHANVSTRRSSLRDVERIAVPLLSDDADVIEMKRLTASLNEMIARYRKAAENVLDRLTKWRFDDSVSRMYAKLLGPECVVDLDLNKEEESAVAAALKERKEGRIPPGYKDSGSGDAIIWMTVIELSKKRKSDAIFVTEDEKADWRDQLRGGQGYTRFELVEEYWRSTGGKSIHIINLAQLLELFQQDKAAVDGARQAAWRSPLDFYGVNIGQGGAGAYHRFAEAMAEKCGGNPEDIVGEALPPPLDSFTLCKNVAQRCAYRIQDITFRDRHELQKLIKEVEAVKASGIEEVFVLLTASYAPGEGSERAAEELKELAAHCHLYEMVFQGTGVWSFHQRRVGDSSWM